MSMRFEMPVRLLALAIVLGSVSIALFGPRRQPNILLVSIDTLRSDHLGCYGYARDTSPTIDRLAREGALFETVLSPSPWTLPSHVTLLTAWPPRAHGVRRANQRLREAATTLPEVLRNAGYRTVGFVSGPFLSSTHGFAQGFDLYDESTIAEGGLKASHSGLTSPRLVELVSGWLEDWASSGRERPFFLFLHMWDPHYDYNPPPPYDTLFDPDYRGHVSGKNFETGGEVHKGMDPRDLEHVIALYDSEIRYTDDHLGRIIEKLRQIGELEDTIVVVTSDHGEEFFEHGSKGHTKALFEESLRVPLVIRYGRLINAGRRYQGVVRTMDIAPTVLGLAGIDHAEGFGFARTGPDGARDLSPWLTGARPDDTFPHLLAYGDCAFFHATDSVRSDRAKLIVRRHREMLFALDQDPGEQRNLARDGLHGVGRKLQEERRRWAELLPKEPTLSEPTKLPRRHEERLRALGYIR